MTSKMRVIKQDEIYKHFKGEYYKVTTVATHTETKELMVIYAKLNNPCMIYARPLDMFVSEVDKEKHPNVEQEYRFQLL